ncbi:HD domain protein [uncultured archaeon]|nr:HD domain protein [uncultured archaeon]
MNEKDLSICHRWFDDYTNGFHSQNQETEKNIILKLNHTYRVCDNITKIAKSTGLRRIDMRLAKAIALFHDIGRFEQLQIFGSFNDRITVDHAALGLKVLGRSGILKDLPGRERYLLQRAIWLHNKFAIPDTEKADSLLYSRLIRDADKLDILGLLTLHFDERAQNPNSALDYGLDDSNVFSMEAISDILQGKMVRIAVLKNLSDIKLMYLSWAYDIYFPFTLSCIEENGYMERLIRHLPADPEISRAVDHIKAYNEKRQRAFI